jgi:general secretion pathway protein N
MRRLKTPGKILSTVAAASLGAAALLWWFPARWAMPWLRGALHGLDVRQVSGTLWDGRAGQLLTRDGRALGAARWQLSRGALFGRVVMQLDVDGPRFALHGQLRRHADGVAEWSGVSLRVDGALLAAARPRLPLGQVRGEFDLADGHAVLRDGWPSQLQASWQWRRAALAGRAGEVALGNLHGELAAADGVIRLPWQDDGNGPLRTAGELLLSPLGWRLDATAQARQGNAALRRWLLALGTPAADGTVHVQRRGGLAAAFPPENPAR